MKPILITIEGSSGIKYELAHRVEEITGETPIRFRRHSRLRIRSIITGISALGSFLITGKSAGAWKLVDALGSDEGREWCSVRKVVILLIDLHMPGSDMRFLNLRNDNIRRCYSTYQRRKWPRGAAVLCTCGNNTMSQQFGSIDHHTIINSDETGRLIRLAWSEACDETFYNEYDNEKK